MARLPRIIVPGIPHHVTQRGNRRQQVFLQQDDYALYRDLFAQHCIANGVACWSYCLMPNHVHLILVPSDDQGLSRAIGETHRRYAGYINARLRVTGHLFQGRFGCVAMDEAHLVAAFRYIALNPVKAKLVDSAVDWRWSSMP
ncbi:MAG: transposase, partial [Salinisphaera sp.]|nr:transposase [Salinisphaera sp.]